MFFSPNNIILVSDSPGTITIEDTKSIDTAYFINLNGEVIPLRYCDNDLIREAFESIIKHTDSGYDYWSLRDILAFADRFSMKIDKVSFVAMWKYLDFLKSKNDPSFEINSLKSPNFFKFKRNIIECHSSVSVEYKCDISSYDCKTDNSKKTAKFAGFPGVGKTYTVEHNKKPNISMVDATMYTYILEVADTSNSRDEAIEKYVEYVISLIGIVDVIFIPDDTNVIKVLHDKYPEVKYTIIYPREDYRDEYITRLYNKLKIKNVISGWDKVKIYTREQLVLFECEIYNPMFLVLYKDHPYITFNDINDTFEKDIVNSKQDIETR